MVEAQTLMYRGLMATQQGGTFPVEGFGYYFITQDGTGITAFGLYEQGALASTPALVDGYNALLNVLVGTIR